MFVCQYVCKTVIDIDTFADDGDSGLRNIHMMVKYVAVFPGQLYGVPS